MPLAPPAPPIVDREYRTPWGYFDPQAVFGFAPLTLASLPRRFDVGTIPGIEFNPSLARLPQGIAAMLSSELGLREGTPGPVHVVLLKCMDGVCDRLRNKNRTFSGNGGFCRGSGGSVAVHCALLDENYSTVAVAQTMASFPTKDAMDVRIETHGDRIYAAHLQPHNPMRWCLSELSFSFNGTRTDTYGSQRDPKIHGKPRRPAGKLLFDMVPIRQSKFAEDPLDFCAVGARNIIPIHHGDEIHFVHWLAEPFMLLKDLGVDRVWEDRAEPPGTNPEGSLVEPMSLSYASTFTGPEATEDTALAHYRHEGNVEAKAPFSYLRGVGDRRLHSNGFALPLPDGKRLLMMGHVHTDTYTEPFKYGNTYLNHFVLVESTPPFKFLEQSPPFCFPAADNSSECESIQFVMTARMLPGGGGQSRDTRPPVQERGRPAGADGNSDPVVQFAYGINDCSGATLEMPLSQILAYTQSRAVPGGRTGLSDRQIAQLFGAPVDDREAYRAVQSCATTSSRVDKVRRLNPRTGADDPTNGDWFCGCRANHTCAGRGCPGDSFSAGAGAAWFPADCGACKLWCKYTL